MEHTGIRGSLLLHTHTHRYTVLSFLFPKLEHCYSVERFLLAVEEVNLESPLHQHFLYPH